MNGQSTQGDGRPSTPTGLARTEPSIASIDPKAIQRALAPLSWLSAEERESITDALIYRHGGSAFGPAVAGAMDRCAGGQPASQTSTEIGLIPFIGAALLYASNAVDLNKKQRTTWQKVRDKIDALGIDRHTRMLLGVMYGGTNESEVISLHRAAKLFGLPPATARANHNAALRALYDACCEPS